jgi:hypothetical protein
MEHLSTTAMAAPATEGRRRAGGDRRRRTIAVVAAATAVTVALAGAALAHGSGAGGDGAGEVGGGPAGRQTTAPAAPTGASPVRGETGTPVMAPATTAPVSEAGTSNATPTTAARASSVSASAGASLSTSPEGYVTAAFDAWLQGNDRRLRKLATAPVAAFLAARTPHESGEWSGPTCEGAAGSSYCAWTQADAQIVLRLNNEAASLGRKHAVVEAFFIPPAGGVAVWPFTTAEQAANTQAGVDQGHQPWLLDPAAVAVSYAQAELGWQDAGVDQVMPQPAVYRVTDPASGTQADLTMAQVVREGSGGIWAVVRAGSAPVG